MPAVTRRQARWLAVRAVEPPDRRFVDPPPDQQTTPAGALFTVTSEVIIPQYEWS